MNIFETLRLERETLADKKNKKKARRFAIIYLLLLLFVFLFPFIIPSEKEDKLVDAIVIDFRDDTFTDSESSTQRSSSRPAPAAATSENQEETPVSQEQEVVEEVVEQPVEQPVEEITPPEPVRKPTPQVPKVTTLKSTKPLLTSPSAEIKLPPSINKLDFSKNAQMTAVSNEIVEVTEEVSRADTKAFIDNMSSFFKKSNKSKSSGSSSSSSSSNSSTADGTGNSNSAGEGDTGSSDSGDSKTDGLGDSGDAGMGFDGNGLLTRKVVYRASLTEIIKKSGKIVINLCVNRDGKVTYSKIDKKLSTIRDPLILKKAEFAAQRYRYEKDYSVAERQCGRLSFIVKIQK